MTSPSTKRNPFPTLVPGAASGSTAPLAVSLPSPESATLVVQTTNDPTIRMASELQAAYDFFNTELYEAKLPRCLITLQRKRGARGYFAYDRFTNRTGEFLDEIALNPRWFKHRSFIEVMSTLVHEMAHLWQRHFGQPGRSGYHNKQWAGEMLRLGLRPSRTGANQGPITGRSMTHYIKPGERFDVAANKLRALPLSITWFDSDGPRPPPVPASLGEFSEQSGRRAKFTCPSCKDSAWGKPSLQIDCRKCERAMERAR
jgi:hypothetical protein